MIKGSDNDLSRAWPALRRSLPFLRGEQLSSSPSSGMQNMDIHVHPKTAIQETTGVDNKPRPWRYVRWRKAHQNFPQRVKEKQEIRGNFYHKVLPDEDLFDVAAKHATYPEVLMEANNILNPVNIANGQILWVPRTHLIQWGDTLWSLSRKCGVSIQSIQAANGIADPNLIYAGDIAVIPEEPDNRAAW